MPGEAYAGRLGGLAIAVGLTAAVATGWNSAIAWADEAGGTAGSAPSSSTSDAGSATANPPDAATTTTTKLDSTSTTTASTPTESVTDEPSGKPETKIGSDGTTAKPTRKRTPPSMSNDTGPKDRPTEPVIRKESMDTTSRASDSTDPVAPSPRTASPLSSPLVPTVTMPTPKPVQPNMVSVVSSVLSGVVTAILSPFAASGTPGAPAETPWIWSLLAFARREFENAFSTPTATSKPADAPTTATVQPEERTLILTAFPTEADAILARTTLDPNPSVVVDGQHYYLGTLGGRKVIVAMTGIGMVNAAQTTEIALDHFTPESGTSIGAVVFSGVAGGSGRTEIGSVAIPARWTSDDGQTWHPVDASMLAAANALDVNLLSSDSIGDPGCYCGLFAGPQISLGREPQLFVGGDGASDDHNGTAFPALPSIPLLGDVFGAQPCRAPDFSLLFTGNLFRALVPWLSVGLLGNITGFLTDVPPSVDAVDQETAAAQQVADAHGIPFLGIRGTSDGPGDPLNLPGYPFTFFVYKQLAADNAAIVTTAFMQSWGGT
jgi:nucleoside phosphorylase